MIENTCFWLSSVKHVDDAMISCGNLTNLVFIEKTNINDTYQLAVKTMHITRKYLWNRLDCITIIIYFGQGHQINRDFLHCIVPYILCFTQFSNWLFEFKTIKLKKNHTHTHTLERLFLPILTRGFSSIQR